MQMKNSEEGYVEDKIICTNADHVLAMMVWGHDWHGSAIHCQCDNQALVGMLASHYSWHMHLLGCLFFLKATYRLTITASHSPGCMNTCR